MLETLQHHKLYDKASKCQFCSSFVGSLGHIISASGPGLAIDPHKV